MCLVLSSICVLSALRRTADSASESLMESQDQEEVADSASESSALEQVQERAGLGFWSLVFPSNRSFFAIKRSMWSWKRLNHSCCRFPHGQLTGSLRSWSIFFKDQREQIDPVNLHSFVRGKTVKNIRKICFFSVNGSFFQSELILSIFLKDRRNQFTLFNLFQRSTSAIH